MSSFWWTLLATLFAVFLPAKCQSTAFPVIPSHLVECYQDDGIYHRANRMPSTFESFLDLIRKMEESPTARNMNARELSLALLHFLKQDGIQSVQFQNKYFPNTIVPFAPFGGEYFKHRLVLVGLIPRIDSSYMAVLNETLSKKEMCNLHFMLSYSIDPYKRDDEKCSPLFDKFRRETNAASVRRPGINFHGNDRTYYRRHRRDIDEEENRFGARGAKTNTPVKIVEKELNGVFNLSSEISNPKTKPWVEDQDLSQQLIRILQREKRNSDGDSNKKLDAEEIPQQQLGAQGKHFHEEKDKFTIGDQELLSARESQLKMGMQSLIQTGPFGKHGGVPYAKPVYSVDESANPIPFSDCPVVNGIVSTPFGSLAIGTVIAGIAAGLNPEEIPPVKLSVDPAELESPVDRIKNIWATTLAGTVADVISSPALLDMDNFQIQKGGWNDSYDMKWYLLSNSQYKHLSEVALRGGLDGLFLGLHAKEWTGRFPGFKLSQMLQTYYDCLWGNVGAKYRVERRSEYAPDELFRKQVYLMSHVLKKQKMNVLTVLKYNQITRETVGKVIQHIEMMDDKEKSHIGSFLRTKIENSVNMIAVIDSSWGYENLYKIFQVLRQAQVVGVVGSNLTIICGKDGRVLATSKNSADIYSRFTKDMLFENCTRGMDFPLMFDTLDTIYRKIYYDEKTSLKMNTDAQVTVLFPFESLLQDNSYLVDKSRNFRSSFPGVRLMIASNGRSESFLPLVKNEKDLFAITLYPIEYSLKAIEEFADGVKQSYQRLSRPSCGSYFDDQSAGTETRVTKDVSPGNVVYYRLLPQYFYTQHGQAIVTIKSRLRAPLTVCHSREMERPSGPTPRGGPEPDYNYNGRGSDFGSDFPPEAYLRPYGRQTKEEPDGPVQCKTITSESYRIEMNNPCEGASSLQDCLPLYISLTPPLQETVSIICPNCRLPTNVEYEISVTGLTCYNSATALLSSPLLFILILFHFLKY